VYSVACARVPRSVNSIGLADSDRARVLNAWFRHVERNELDSLRSLLTDDFLFVSEGERLSPDAFVRTIQSLGIRNPKVKLSNIRTRTVGGQRSWYTIAWRYSWPAVGPPAHRKRGSLVLLGTRSSRNRLLCVCEMYGETLGLNTSDLLLAHSRWAVRATARSHADSDRCSAAKNDGSA
jgi:hypothetical protein